MPRFDEWTTSPVGHQEGAATAAPARRRSGDAGTAISGVVWVRGRGEEKLRWGRRRAEVSAAGTGDGRALVW